MLKKVYRIMAGLSLFFSLINKEDENLWLQWAIYFLLAAIYELFREKFNDSNQEKII